MQEAAALMAALDCKNETVLELAEAGLAGAAAARQDNQEDQPERSE